MSICPVRLSRLLAGSRVRPLGAVGADPEILGASLDSRRVRPGNLFFAIRGFRVDGEAFVAEAIQRGARAVVAGTPRPANIGDGIGWVQVEEPRTAAGLLSRECFARPDEALTLVGITGTNGKTTVAHVVESIGIAAGRRSGRIGTNGCAYGGLERPLERTTPEAPEFYRLLAEMRDHDVEMVSMEVSSHALSLGRVEGARFAAAVFLNLSHDHLDFHPDEMAYFNAKARLFESLEPDATAILPADSEYGERLAPRTRARVMTFGRSQSSDIRLGDEYCGLDGSSAILQTPKGRLPIRTFLLGRVNLENVTAAAASALAVGLPPESIPPGVLALAGVPGRLERIDRGQPFTVLVDYAHTGAALARVLDWAAELVNGNRLLVVFGCGGERDADKRPVMGRIAAKAADELFLTSDNPREEDPAEILAAVERGVEAARGDLAHCRSILDRREAIEVALAEARPGDIVVIAGKGHETVQVIGDRKQPFDDRQVAREALARQGWEGGAHAGA